MRGAKPGILMLAGALILGGCAFSPKEAQENGIQYTHRSTKPALDFAKCAQWEYEEREIMMGGEAHRLMEAGPGVVEVHTNGSGESLGSNFLAFTRFTDVEGGSKAEVYLSDNLIFPTKFLSKTVASLEVCA